MSKISDIFNLTKGNPKSNELARPHTSKIRRAHHSKRPQFEIVGTTRADSFEIHPVVVEIQMHMPIEHGRLYVVSGDCVALANYRKPSNRKSGLSDVSWTMRTAISVCVRAFGCSG